MISYYNTCPQKNQAGEVIKELIDAKNIAFENIERVIGRDEKLNIIAVKSEALNNQSRNFNFIALYVFLLIFLNFFLFFKFLIWMFKR